LGIKDAPSSRIATPFGGGIGRNQLLCGVIGGGVMVIGLLWGRDDDSGERRESYEKASELLDSFRKEFGSVECRELLGVDLRSEQGMKTYRKKLHYENCHKYLSFVSEWLIQQKK
jgi:C_GCAxxG_C_C family probable redox protein